MRQTCWYLTQMLTLDILPPPISFPTTDEIRSSSGQKNTRENIVLTAFMSLVFT